MNATQGKFPGPATITTTTCYLLVLFQATCAAQTKLPEAARQAIAARHAGQTVELRQSCYYGDLYDENQRWLLSPYPFVATSHIVDLDNNPIHPKHQRGIIAAGTRFVVERVEFPVGWDLSQRLLTTPRSNPWVYLRPAPTETRAPRTGKMFVWVLPTELDTTETFEAALTKGLAPDGEVSKWLSTVRPTVRVAIENKDILAGMTLRELTASQGEPVHWYIDTYGKDKAAQVAWFPLQEAWLVNDVVVEVKPSRNSDASVSTPGPSSPPLVSPEPSKMMK